MKINEWLTQTREEIETGMESFSFFDEPYLKNRQRLTCKDGFSMSIQASCYHYCSPRTSVKGTIYDTVEIGFPTAKESLIASYAEDATRLTGTVYGYVPVEIIDQVIEKHGGMALN